MWEESPKADEQLKLSDSAAYPSFLPELCKFRHKRGVWSNGLQTLLLEAPGRIDPVPTSSSSLSHTRLAFIFSSQVYSSRNYDARSPLFC